MKSEKFVRYNTTLTGQGLGHFLRSLSLDAEYEMRRSTSNPAVKDEYFMGQCSFHRLERGRSRITDPAAKRGLVASISDSVSSVLVPV